MTSLRVPKLRFAITYLLAWVAFSLIIILTPTKILPVNDRWRPLVPVGVREWTHKDQCVLKCLNGVPVELWPRLLPMCTDKCKHDRQE